MGKTVADTLAPLIRKMVNDENPVKIACWDGSRAGPSAAPWQLNVSRRGLRRLLWAPNEVGLARAWVSGDIDMDGDVLACLEALEKGVEREYGASKRHAGHSRGAFAVVMSVANVLSGGQYPSCQSARQQKSVDLRGRLLRLVDHDQHVRIVDLSQLTLR
jgi:hypothetical protein